MKFDVLHTFISPVTGRILADYKYVPVGNSQGIAIPSPILIDIRLDLINLRKRYNSLVDADLIVGHPNDQIPNAQVLSILSDGYIVNTAGIVSTTSTIPSGDLHLTHTYLFTGDIFNRAIEVQTIIVDNLPALTLKRIWRGNAFNRPVEVDDLTTLESELSDALSQLADLASLVSSILSIVNGLQAAVAALEAGLASIGGWVAIAAMQTEIIGLITAVALTNSRIDNLRLNNIPADADVSLSNFKIINLSDPINPQDAATKAYVDSIGGGAAPNTATYIIQTANASLPNAQILASLATGLVKNTTTTGVLTIGVPGTDYYSPDNPTTLIDDFNLNGSPSSSYGNVGVGTLALDSLVLNSATNTYNTAIGSEALYAFTTGADNTALGQASLFSLTSGNDNTALGTFSLYSLTSGNYNTGVGSFSLYSLTSGDSNTAIGLSSLVSFTSGDNNTALGTSALTSFTSGSSNVVVGKSAAYAMTSGDQNCIFGTDAMPNVTSGSNRNSIFGFNAAQNQAIYNSCVFLGANADASANNLTNAIAIGDGALVGASNSMVLGSGVKVGIGTSTPAFDLDVNGDINGTWVGTIISLAKGGTNANLTASNGGVVYSTATAMAISSAPAISNEILMGQVGGAPIWSNATYPSSVLPGQLLYGSGLFSISGLTMGPSGVLVTDSGGNPSILAGNATANRVLLSGASVAPAWSTATYPATTTISQLLYSSAANTIVGLATANNSVLVTNGSGVPSISSTLPTAVQGNITTVGTISSGTWNGSIIGLSYGGSNANLTASNGGIVYSTASAMAILSGTATANRVLLSGSSAAPAWSTATYPATTTINQLLYSSAANTIVGLATANNSVLLTNGSGVPAWQTLTSSAVTSIAGTADQITASASTGAVTLSMPSDVIITTSVAAGNLKMVTNTLQSTNTNGNILITPNGTGNVGISTASPTQARVVITGGVQNISNEESALRAIGSLNHVQFELQNTAAGGKLYEIRSSNNGQFDITDRTGVVTRFIITSSGNVGIGGSPSFLCDVNGTTRAKKLLGNATAPTVSLGATGQVGTGASSSVTGSELGGRFSLTTGTGVLTTGTLATFTLGSAMPSSTFSVVFQSALGGRALNVNSTSSTQFTIDNTGLTALAASTTYTWNYQIVGY